MMFIKLDVPAMIPGQRTAFLRIDPVPQDLKEPQLRADVAVLILRLPQDVTERVRCWGRLILDETGAEVGKASWCFSWICLTVPHGLGLEKPRLAARVPAKGGPADQPGLPVRLHDRGQDQRAVGEAKGLGYGPMRAFVRQDMVVYLHLERTFRGLLRCRLMVPSRIANLLQGDLPAAVDLLERNDLVDASAKNVAG